METKRELLSRFLLEELASGVLTLRPVVATRGGYYRRKTVDDLAEELAALGCRVERGNDAPRGGKAGEYIRIALTPELTEEFRSELAEAERQRQALSEAFKAEVEKARTYLSVAELPTKRKEVRTFAWQHHKAAGVSVKALVVAVRERLGW